MVTTTTLNNPFMTGDRLWEIRIPYQMMHVRGEVEKFVSRVVAWGVTHDESLALRHSLHEAVVNTVRYGNAGEPNRQIRICYRFLRNDIFIEDEDEGRGFDRELVSDLTTDKNQISRGGTRSADALYKFSRVQRSWQLRDYALNVPARLNGDGAQRKSER
jgi:hypothetical protein